MLQMDSQWKTLLSSYNENYMQYGLTRDQNYKQSADAAKQGLDNILATLKAQVDDQNKAISEFNNSNIKNQINDLKNQEADLRQSMLSQEDMLTTAQMRQQQVSPNFFSSISKENIIGISVLTAVTIGLALL